MCSWSRWPRQVAGWFVHEALSKNERELAITFLGAQHGRDFAADVLASLSADIQRAKER